MANENVIADKEIPAYPTCPDADGFYYESEEDKTLGILTKIYENGSKVKQAVLPQCGKTAVVRELTAKETKDIQRYMGNDKDAFLMSAITVATTIDGEKQPFEFFDGLKMKDYNRVMSMYGDLNF
jgi:hypothetical protein